MDMQPKPTENTNYDQGYHDNDSYHYSQSPSGNKTEAELALERELIINEYRSDRDAILLAIKQAVKDRNYKEAQEFIYKYRAATKFDDNFAVLARMTSQGIENEKKIEKIVTVLEATPDDDYETRIAICERILKIVPDHDVYLKELKKCKEALQAQNGQIKKANTDNPPAKSSNTSTIVIGGLFILIIILILFFFV